MKQSWDHPEPFILELRAGTADVDSYGHVNNVVYLRWLEQCAWAHSAAVGLPESRCIEMKRGMAVRSIRLDYLAACYAGDEILVGNWISRSDRRLRISRRYQLINGTRDITVMRGEIDFVCLNLANGRPVRLPPEFIEAYRVVLDSPESEQTPVSR